MATSGELITTTAKVVGMAETTIASYFRSLRKERLVNTGGRGPSAALMTARDAALLLIAIAGGRSDRESADKIVVDFKKVQAEVNASQTWSGDDDQGRDLAPDWQEDVGRWYFPGFSLPSLQRLDVGHSLADGITAIIEAAAAGEFETCVAERYPGKTVSYGIEISVYGPEPRAGIRIDFWPRAGDRYVEEVTYILADRINQKPENHREVDAELRDRFSEGDLEIRRTLTHKTIFAVAAAIKAGRGVKS